MPGEPDVSDHTLLLGLVEGLEHSILTEVEVDIGILNLMNHPEVDVVGLEPLHLGLKHLEGFLLVSPGEGDVVFLGVVDAGLGHDEGLLAPASGECLTHPILRTAGMVFPGVVKEGNSLVNGVMGDVGGLLHGRRKGERVTPEPDATQHLLMPAEFPLRDRPRRDSAG